MCAYYHDVHCMPLPPSLATLLPTKHANSLGHSAAAYAPYQNSDVGPPEGD